MSVFDLLTDNDKNLIEKYIKAFGSSNRDQNKFPYWAGLPTVLKEWTENKETLSTLLGNKLIIRRPYSYEAQAEALTRDIDKAFKLDPEPQAFWKWWRDLAHRERHSISIQILDENTLYYGTPSAWLELGSCFSSNVLAMNQYLNANCVITLPSGTKMKIFRGMKPMKILHKFVQEFNGPEDLFDAFRIWHSRQLNQKTIDGELCLSIHPLDFMTMSDNDNDWSSCMRWEDISVSSHGDYRGGTVSCLNSSYILVAYLHNPNHKYNQDWLDFSWNSKQWRELFLIQEGIITEIKGYPFQDQYLTNTCLMWIKELAEKNLGWTYNDEEINVINEIKTKSNNPLMFTFNPGTFMYNDMGTLDMHRGRINTTILFGKYKKDEIHKENKLWKTFIDIDYGGIATCMCCGADLEEDVVGSECVFCNKCDLILKCPHCGRAIYTYDDRYWINEYDSPICEDCRENCCGWDSFTDEPHLLDELTTIHVLLGKDDSGDNIFLDEIAYCYYPEDNPVFSEIFNNKIKYMYTNWYTYTYVTLDMIRPGQEDNFKDIFELPHKAILSELINEYI